MKKLVILLIIASLVLTLFLIKFLYYKPADSAPLVDSSFISSLPQKDESKIDTTHLKDGLIPPTNKWFSGLALQSEPKTVFPNPLSFKVSNSSFSYALPKVTTSADTITNTVGEYLRIEVIGADSYKVVRYDELSVDIGFFTGAEEIGIVTIAQGSPYIFYSATKDSSLEIVGTSNPVLNSNHIVYSNQDATYHGSVFNGATNKSAGQKTEILSPKGSHVSFYALLNDAVQDPLRDYAENRITSVKVDYLEQQDGFNTEITINTMNNKTTLFGFMKHHTTKHNIIYNYSTIYGQLRIGEGSKFIYFAPSVPVSESLNLDYITDEQKTLLANTVRQEINATKYIADDTYFAGKELYRSAQLLELATQVGETESASTIKAKLNEQMGIWFAKNIGQGSRYFYYDSRMKSIVGVSASFGSNEINDHHFHYGYFIYASATLAKYDETFINRHGSAVNAIVADIANYNDSELLPKRRSFDPYRGHSWASGSAPFNDGNNQESSSEAIQAWVATSLWAKLTNNQKLALQSGWMLAGEVQATNEYWLGIDTTQSPYNNIYNHRIVSLNWGGKRDYLTFFSNEASAKFAIQLIPMNPTSQSILKTDKLSMQSMFDEASVNSQSSLFADYLLMYSSLIDPNNKLQQAKDIPIDKIDGANSRSYIYAWIISQQ